MVPQYVARIEDLDCDDFVKVDSATCHHVALLRPGALQKLGLSPATKVLDLNMRGQVPRLWGEVASRRFGQVGAPAGEPMMRRCGPENRTRRTG